VPPHFFIHHLTESRADLPDRITGQRCYSFFDSLTIPIPDDLSFTISTNGFEAWWSMWKTHVFRRALGPMLKQLDAHYVMPTEQVTSLARFFPKHLPQFPIIMLCFSSATRRPRTYT
jgi:hypothetical protein